MNRFSTLAKLADSMLTTSELVWTAAGRKPMPTPPAPPAPVAAWTWGPAPLGD